MAGSMGKTRDQNVGCAHLAVVAFGTGKVYAQVEDTEIRKSENDMDDTIVVQTARKDYVKKKQGAHLPFQEHLWTRPVVPTCHSSLAEDSVPPSASRSRIAIPLEFQKMVISRHNGHRGAIAEPIGTSPNPKFHAFFRVEAILPHRMAVSHRSEARLATSTVRFWIQHPKRGDFDSLMSWRTLLIEAFRQRSRDDSSTRNSTVTRGILLARVVLVRGASGGDRSEESDFPAGATTQPGRE